MNFRYVLSFVPAVLFGLLYGALSHYLFGSVLQGVASVLSLAFIVVVPFVIGMLATYSLPPAKRTSLTYAIGFSLGAMALGSLLAGVLVWEAAICIAMALPIMLGMAALGGALMAWVLSRRTQTTGTSLMALFVLLPFLLVPLERQFPIEDSFHTVETQITINADAQTVWENIVRVQPIQDSERPYSILFSFFGAPKPLEADMLGAGVGGVRRGHFDGGLQFVETISLWEPAKRIEWDITPDNAGALLAPWNAIGGKPFAVPHAAYWIEPIGDHQVILHLNSNHRLTTRFNAYGGLWTQWGMREFQNYILTIIKARAEKA